MEYKIQRSQTAKAATGCLVVPVIGKANTWTRQNIGSLLKEADRLTGGAIISVLKQGDLATTPGQCLLLPAPKGLKARRLLLVYAGSKNNLSTEDATKVVDGVAKALSRLNTKSALIAWQELRLAEQQPEWMIRYTVQALDRVAYRFTEYKSKPDAMQTLQSVSVVPPAGSQAAEAALQEARAIAAGLRFTKDLGNLPGNQCTPSFLARAAKNLAAEDKNTKVTVLNEAQMKKLKMGALLSVTAGTKEPAQLIVLQYSGGKKSEAPTALVGKGITFDSGGISIKPSAKMDEMKFDMCGAATVLGVFRAIIDLQLPVNLVGVIAAAENMPGGNATKPGDIVTSMSKQTIEVLNTDAEGRLVLCDAITYTSKFKPKYVIDIATLTGACVVALGSAASGLYANDDELAEKLLQAGENSQDRAWRMPLWDDYQKQIDSRVADIANVGEGGAGSVTAACFLARFAKKMRWAHFDIAGTAWAGKRATGKPVFLLCQFLLNEHAANS